MSDKLLKLFSEIFDIPENQLNDKTSPDNTPQWDSLAAMTLVAAIEHEFNVELTTKEILQMSNIGAVRETLKNKNITL